MSCGLLSIELKIKKIAMKLTKTVLKQMWLATLLLAIAAASFAEETIRITNGEWPPYLSIKSPYHGLASHIVSEAFALEGVKPEYGFFPWKRSYKLAESGMWDGSAVWVYSKERAEKFYFSDPIIETKWVFFHLKTTNFDWKTVDDLKKYKIGATLEYNYGRNFERAERNGILKVHRIPRDEQNFKKLVAGRIDVFPLDLLVGYSMLNDLISADDIQLVTHHHKPLKVVQLHLILSKKVKKNEHLMKRFNRGLKRLHELGRIEKMMADLITGKYSVQRKQTPN